MFTLIELRLNVADKQRLTGMLLRYNIPYTLKESIVPACKDSTRRSKLRAVTLDSLIQLRDNVQASLKINLFYSMESVRFLNEIIARYKDLEAQP